MFPVQVLVVLSTMIVINQAATLNYETQQSVTPSNLVDKEAYEMLNQKTSIGNGDYSQISPPYDVNATEFLDDSVETALPALKSFPWLLVTDVLRNALKVANGIINN